MNMTITNVNKKDDSRGNCQYCNKEIKKSDR